MFGLPNLSKLSLAHAPQATGVAPDAQRPRPPLVKQDMLSLLPGDVRANTLASGNVQSMCAAARVLSETNRELRDTTAWMELVARYDMPVPWPVKTATVKEWRLYVMRWCNYVNPMDDLSRQVVLAKLKFASDQVGFNWVIHMTGAEYTPERSLLWASGIGHADVVRRLIAAGVVFDHANQDGNTPLFKASWNGHSDVVRELIRAGVNLDWVSEYGWTALSLASHNGQEDVVDVLIGAKANVNIADEGEGITALMHASRQGNVAIVKLLIAASSSINTENFYGRTALMQAIYKGPAEVVAVVNVLIGARANVNTRDAEGWTPLALASRNGYVHIVELLLRGGANLEATNDYGLTALMHASQSGHAEIVRLLLNNKADVNHSDEDGDTALWYALGPPHQDIVALLIAAGASQVAA